MAAPKGHKKWGGRSKGATNKTTRQLRETISDFLTKNFEKIERDFNKLSPKEKLKAYCDLLQYGLPKLQSVSMGFQLEKLTDEQLGEIIDELKHTASENT